ncbi:hypothetical protein BDN72DRAFT_289265 [Pluteus cervinus]|uniref:Uncharacterized protein n=1 Tax=Pluteus cervinus TaxID=181527 RepID=A0ACD3AF84_9AGAR|nr:hypothetical protein BDN72DRAFT_289265 [Pluteus cervinus]
MVLMRGSLVFTVLPKVKVRISYVSIALCLRHDLSVPSVRSRFQVRLLHSPAATIEEPGMCNLSPPPRPSTDQYFVYIGERLKATSSLEWGSEKRGNLGVIYKLFEQRQPPGRSLPSLRAFANFTSSPSSSLISNLTLIITWSNLSLIFSTRYKQSPLKASPNL